MKQEQQKLSLFQGQEIRKIWDEEKQEWYFSIIDIVAVLTEQTNYKKAQSYWTTLKSRLKTEGSEIVTDCDKLKLEAADGKKYLTDVGNTQTLLRLIQSIPSKKAEPFKMWLAQVGDERIKEIDDPEKSMKRMLDTYEKNDILKNG